MSDNGMKVIGSGEGFEAFVDGTTLVLRIDTTGQGTPSSSGKNMVIATTRGNQSFNVGGKTVTVGLNAYVKR
jgi:hypothetical protein